MIVICDGCGKRYRIDPLKIEGKQARVSCKACDHMITVVKPEAEPAKPPLPVPPVGEQVPLSEPEKKTKPAPSKKQKTPGRQAGKLGLRGKMAIYFFMIPVILIACAGALYVWQLNDVTSLLTNESSSAMRKMAEDAIAENARAVAKQCGRYLSNNPLLKKEDLNDDTGFKMVAVQQVGMTGHSYLYSGPDEKGLNSLRVHPHAKLIGIDFPKAMRKALGREYHRWWRIYKGAFEGKETRGYFLLKDADGRLREKFMVCAPVEGTPYIIASATYLDEFTGPVKVMEMRAEKLTAKTRNMVLGVFTATIILIGLTVSLYARRITGRIKSLTDVMNRITVGKLDAEIEIGSHDEIGDLRDAVARMQDSIRLSIERLRRRR
ncbi:MAG: HAMP domain-containing protein [Deltaproteobacteria bacterium]|nr:HAMP domain-containing protein [Deltaproteobacteria bacterium]